MTGGILAVLLAVILIVVLSSPLARPPSPAERVDIGFTSTEGLRLTTSSVPFAGKVVVVDLMAALCPPCNAEMPELLAFRAAIREMDVEIISLSIWAGQPGFGETVADLEAFQERWGADWVFGVPDDTLLLVLDYQVQFPPFKILLDRNGDQVGTIPGETTSGALLQAITEVL
ncbi:MAG: TlpA family protein disulfide reductase [Thermoplasmata archaeon]